MDKTKGEGGSRGGGEFGWGGEKMQTTVIEQQQNNLKIGKKWHYHYIWLLSDFKWISLKRMYLDEDKENMKYIQDCKFYIEMEEA